MKKNLDCQGEKFFWKKKFVREKILPEKNFVGKKILPEKVCGPVCDKFVSDFQCSFFMCLGPFDAYHH